MTRFAERLEWLLTVVPRNADQPDERFTHADVEAATGAHEGAGSTSQPDQPEGGWLDAARRGAVDLADPRHRFRLHAVEDLFRLPRGYFLDASLAVATDELIALVAQLRDRGTTIIGPCRTASAQLGVAEMRQLSWLLKDAYERRA